MAKHRRHRTRVSLSQYFAPFCRRKNYMSRRMCSIGIRKLCFLVSLLCVIFLAIPLLHAADDSDDLDQYKLRIGGFWFYSNPSGSFQGSGSTDLIDIDRDLGFSSYSTFAGYVDWKFT